MTGKSRDLRINKNEVQPNVSGGYISRSQLQNGVYVIREKVNLPSNPVFYKALKDIRDAIKEGMPAIDYEILLRNNFLTARFEVYDPTGAEMVMVLPCTHNQAMTITNSIKVF